MALSTAHYAYYYFSLFRAEMVVNGRWYPWCSSLAYSFITLYFLTKKINLFAEEKKDKSDWTTGGSSGGSPSSIPGSATRLNQSR